MEGRLDVGSHLNNMMKLKVEVYKLDNEGTDRKAGAIYLDGAELTASDDSQLLKNILELPIQSDGKRLYAKDDPERFMRSLHENYTSPYLRCTKAS